MLGMKGVRALASGMLVLGAVCAVPAVSAAQDTGTTATTTTTSTTSLLPSTTTTTADAPPEGASAGDTRPSGEDASPQPAAASVGVPAAAPSTDASAHIAASASVTMGDFFFQPASVTVAVGDTVTWHNSGQAPHTATADDGSFDTGTIQPGGSGSHTFNSAGTFSYICTIHPNMKGTVRVLASSSGGGGSKGSTGGSSGGSSGSSSSGSSISEAQAVNSPGAAGSSSSLPATGMATGALALIGLVLLASGLLTRRAERRS
jgi:LPXTG-motif cell wall-anchored protein